MVIASCSGWRGFDWGPGRGVLSQCVACRPGGWPYIALMLIPDQVPVVTLTNATLFPRAMLPLFIFEPRYRRMLADVLAGDRMFAVALQKVGRERETPSVVAGIGLVRAAVDHDDGTSHLLLQGLARIELGRRVPHQPYRVHEVSVIETPPCDTPRVHALAAKVRELVQIRLAVGPPLPLLPSLPRGLEGEGPTFGAQKLLAFLDSLPAADAMADAVSCAFLPGAGERQEILELTDVEERLCRLIRLLLAEVGGGKEG